MREPLPWIAAAWALGVLAASPALVPLEAGLVVGVGALAASTVGGSGRWALLLLAAAAGGFVALTLTRDPGLTSRRVGTVEARVDDVRNGATGTWLLLSEAVGVDVEAIPRRLLLRQDAAEVGAGAPLSRARRGDRLRARVRLRPLQPLRNPGGPRSKQRLGLGVGAVGQLVHPALWVRRTLRDEADWTGARALAGLRARLGARLTAEGEGGALLRALALGDRAGLSQRSRDAFRDLGLGHLLAVSGLHLGLLAGAAYALASFALRRSVALSARLDTRRLALVASWLAASLYAVLTGAGVPVQRAWVCLSCPLLAGLLARPGRLRTPLSAAALCVLIADPAALFLPGAQLSFAAAAALSLPRPAAASRGLRGLLHTTATAALATAPLVAWHFGRTAPAAVGLNLVAVPWTAVALLPSALISALVLWPGESVFGATVASAAAALADASLWAVQALAARLGVEMPTRVAPAWIAVAGAFALALLRARRPAASLLGAFAITTFLAHAPDAAIEPAPPRLAALDVGQGDALLVQGRGAALLVDAGVALPGGLDRGRDAVLPALAALGVRRLDVVVASHGDLDHRGGLAAVLRAVPVEALWLPYGARDDPAFATLRSIAAAAGIRVETTGRGAPPRRLGDLEIETLWPPRDAVSAASASGNDRSLVVRVTRAGVRVLLPGDLEAAGERALLAVESDPGADVLLLPHHGSATSSTGSFLDAVAPSLGIVSAPCWGRFAMPAAAVIARLETRGVPLWWTGRDGAVLVGLGPPLHATSWAPSRSHCGRR